MNRLRILLLAVVTSLVVAMTAVLGAPSGSAVTKPQSGTLVLASGSGAPGISVSLRGRIPVVHRTRVELQRLEDSGFVTVTVAKTDALGRFSFTTSVPDDRASASYRVSSKELVTPTRTVVTGTTTRLTQDPDQTKEPYDLIGSYVGGISTDGQQVVYVSQGAVFLGDRQTLTTTRITPDGAPPSSGPAISGDGRYVSYTRNARWGRTNSTGDVLVWDRVSGSTVEVTSNNQGSFANSISGDGRYVAFTSLASDLVAHDTNKQVDLFIWDRQSGTVRRIGAGEGVPYGADISADGRWVTFTSEANDLVAHDNNKHADVFVCDTRTGKTRRVITRGDTVNEAASLSADGRFVAYLTSQVQPGAPLQQTACGRLRVGLRHREEDSGHSCHRQHLFADDLR